MAYVKNRDGVVYEVDDACLYLPLSQDCALATQEDVDAFWVAAFLGQPPRVTPLAPVDPTPAPEAPAN